MSSQEIRYVPVPIDPDFWAGRRVLLTGHTGFKGAWLALWLQALGAKVSGLAPGAPTRPSLYELAGVSARMDQEHAIDVRDADRVHKALREARPEVVLHLAAQPMVRRSLRDPAITYAVNVMGTVNVLEAVRQEQRDIRAVVVVTSDKCYENLFSGAPPTPRRFVEGDPLGGSDPYSSSKACAELVTAAYRRSFFSVEDSARIASARAGNVIGGGDWGEDRLIGDIVRGVQAGEAVKVRNPEAVRPWQHICCWRRSCGARGRRRARGTSGRAMQMRERSAGSSSAWRGCGEARLSGSWTAGRTHRRLAIWPWTRARRNGTWDGAWSGIWQPRWSESSSGTRRSNGARICDG
jgi:nucleoside-diphosphate-sugar epimerase